MDEIARAIETLVAEYRALEREAPVQARLLTKQRDAHLAIGRLSRFRVERLEGRPWPPDAAF